MKKLLLGAAAIVAFAAPALAADLPARTYTKAPAYTAPEAVYNWTGFYIGGHIGGAFGGIVTSLVKDVIMPPIGYMMSGIDFSSL